MAWEISCGCYAMRVGLSGAIYLRSDLRQRYEDLATQWKFFMGSRLKGSSWYGHCKKMSPHVSNKSTNNAFLSRYFSQICLRFLHRAFQSQSLLTNNFRWWIGSARKLILVYHCIASHWPSIWRCILLMPLGHTFNLEMLCPNQICSWCHQWHPNRLAFVSINWSEWRAFL